MYNKKKKKVRCGFAQSCPPRLTNQTCEGVLEYRHASFTGSLLPAGSFFAAPSAMSKPEAEGRCFEDPCCGGFEVRNYTSGNIPGVSGDTSSSLPPGYSYASVFAFATPFLGAKAWEQRVISDPIMWRRTTSDEFVSETPCNLFTPEVLTAAAMHQHDLPFGNVSLDTAKQRCIAAGPDHCTGITYDAADFGVAIDRGDTITAGPGEWIFVYTNLPIGFACSVQDAATFTVYQRIDCCANENQESEAMRRLEMSCRDAKAAGFCNENSASGSIARTWCASECCILRPPKIVSLARAVRSMRWGLMLMGVAMMWV